MPAAKKPLISPILMAGSNTGVLERVVNKRRERAGQDPIFVSDQAAAPSEEDKRGDETAVPESATLAPPTIEAPPASPSPTNRSHGARHRADRAVTPTPGVDRRERLKELAEESPETIVTLRLPSFLDHYVEEYAKRKERAQSGANGRGARYRKQDAIFEAVLDWAAAHPLPDNPMDGID